MDQIKWGIIGCGNVTEIKSGPAFNKIPDSRLVAVMRRDSEKAKDYAARHHVPRWYNDANQLINDPEVNAIYVATPPSSHEEYTIAALQRGKFVYVEKPMSVDASSAKRMADAASRYDLKLCVAHYRRYMPIFKKIKQLLDSGHIGKVNMIELKLFQPYDAPGFAPGPENWRIQPAISGGGIFHDLAPHQLDLLYHYFGIPAKVKGISFNQGGYYDAPDVISASIRFAHNILFNGIWNFNAQPGEVNDMCRITGTAGHIEFGIFKMERVKINTNGAEEEIIFEPLQHVQQPMISEIVQYFLGKRDNPCSGDDGVHVMEMIDQITSSSV